MIIDELEYRVVNDRNGGTVWCHQEVWSRMGLGWIQDEAKADYGNSLRQRDAITKV